MKLTWDSCIIAFTTLSSPTRHSTCHTRCSVCTTPAPILFTCHYMNGLTSGSSGTDICSRRPAKMEDITLGRYFTTTLRHSADLASGTLMTVSFILLASLEVDGSAANYVLETEQIEVKLLAKPSESPKERPGGGRSEQADTRACYTVAGHEDGLTRHVLVASVQVRSYIYAAVKLAESAWRLLTLTFMLVYL
ncbi:unnamed protein product [Notodromas monacha]|uniref:Uncharacterized protein n=1 Tax=Notodromas monacha TaxID=399045 RepID=A0A7R9GAZ1_9CRUS|nr:unnamed protein product [Notodromas monacha]CAG0914243.1 unnamed protein product [Notodromas monacha]